MQSQYQEKYDLIQDKCPLKGTKVLLKPQNSSFIPYLYNSLKALKPESSRNADISQVTQQML